MSLTVGIINACIKEASNSTYRFKIGAVIFKGSRIISKGHNYVRSCSAIKDIYRAWPNSVHSELSAILACKDWSALKGASILVIKISKTEGRLSNARPCKYCEASLRHVGIKNVYYSDTSGSISLMKLVK